MGGGGHAASAVIIMILMWNGVCTYPLLDGQASTPGVASCATESRLTEVLGHLTYWLLVNPVSSDKLVIIESLEGVNVFEERPLPPGPMSVHFPI